MRPVLPDAAKSVVKRKLAAITPAPIAGNGDQLPKDFTTPLHPTSMAGGEKAPAREKGSMMATEPTMSQTEELIRQHEEELALESRMLEGFNLSFQDGYDLIYEQIIEVGNIPYHIEFHLPGPLASASDPDITTDLIIKNMINGEKIVDRSQSGRDIPWALSCMKAAIKTATTTFPEKYSVVSTLSDAPHAGENYRPSLGIDADPVRQVAIEVATDALEEAFRTWPTGSKELEAALDKIAASYSEREGDRIYTDAWDRVYGEEYAKAHLHPYPEGLDGQMPVHIASQPDPQAMSAAEIEKGSTDMAEQTETKWVRMSMNGKLIKEVKPEDGPIFYSAYVPSGTKIGGGHVDIGNSNFTVPQNLVHASKFSAHDVVVAFPEDWDVKLTRSVLNEGTGEYTREPVATVKPQALKEALEAERQHWREARAEARSQAQEQAQAKTTVNTAEKVAKASADAQAKNAPTAPAKKQSK
jgi:hypothetical protein